MHLFDKYTDVDEWTLLHMIIQACKEDNEQ
jgi:hypothetical protein